ncbi:MAG: cyanophycin synthetase, partial [Alkalibacterium sp.]
LFGSERIGPMVERLGLKEDEPLTAGLLTKQIENAQKRIESRNYETRKHVLEYDNVMNRQREAIYGQLADFQLTKNRLEWLDGVNGSVLLNDAYNASPSSVRAVLNYFKGIEVPGRKIVVLGDILELGEQAEMMHRELHTAIDPDSIDELVLYGNFMKALYEEMTGKMDSQKVHHFAGDKSALVSYLNASLKPEDTVLFKSSFSTGMLEVVSKLSQDKK